MTTKSEPTFTLDDNGVQDMKIWQRLKRFAHCLFRFHQSVTMWVDGRVTYIGCDCGRCYYVSTDHQDVRVMGLGLDDMKRQGQI